MVIVIVTNMGYRHTENLYKNQTILLFKECYATEKIHGTSANITFKPNDTLIFYSGGIKHETFKALFNEEELFNKFSEIFTDSEVTIYGEAYGGSCQKMADTYGPDIKFVVFEVKVNDSWWLDVPNAHDVATKLGLEFVHYVRISTDLAAIDAERDAPSVQAQRNGMGDDKIREGVVLRPLVEVELNGGHRIIAKHKRAEFNENKTQKEVSPDKLQVMLEASKIADEWVTENRLKNAESHFSPEDWKIENMGKIIKYITDDVIREGEGEILFSKSVGNMVAKKTAQLFKQMYHKL